MSLKEIILAGIDEQPPWCHMVVFSIGTETSVIVIGHMGPREVRLSEPITDDTIRDAITFLESSGFGAKYGAGFRELKVSW